MEAAKYILFVLTSVLTFAGAWAFSFTETDATTGRKRLTRPGKLALPLALALLIGSLAFAYMDDRDKAKAKEEADKKAAATETALNERIFRLDALYSKVLDATKTLSEPPSAARTARLEQLKSDETLKAAARSNPNLQALLNQLERALGGRSAQLQRLAAAGVALPSDLDDVLIVASVSLKMFGKTQRDVSNAVVGLLRGLGADIATIEEIADVSAFQRLMAKLPQYELVLGGSDSVFTQAVIFRKDRVILKQDVQLVTSETDPQVFQRKPAALRLEARGKPFDLIAIHFRSLAQPQNVERRAREAEALADWIRQRPKDRPLLLAGRLQVPADAPEIAPLAAAGITFSSNELPAGTTTFISDFYAPIVQSHIGFGNSMSARYLTRSVTVYDLRRLLPTFTIKEIVDNVTDNNPISAAFRLD